MRAYRACVPCVRTVRVYRACVPCVRVAARVVCGRAGGLGLALQRRVNFSRVCGGLALSRCAVECLTTSPRIRAGVYSSILYIDSNFILCHAQPYHAWGWYPGHAAYAPAVPMACCAIGGCWPIHWPHGACGWPYCWPWPCATRGGVLSFFLTPFSYIWSGLQWQKGPLAPCAACGGATTATAVGLSHVVVFVPGFM